MSRRDILAHFGATPSEVDELLEYGERTIQEPASRTEFPMEDERFVEAWELYALRAKEDGAAIALREPIVQLSFPIREGISEDPAYRAVVRRGQPVSSCPLATGLPLNQPDRIRLFLHPTAAGKIPVIAIADRDDFENILRATTRRNEPAPIPGSVGAMTVSGYNNWDRLDRYRRGWEARNAGGDWSREFRRVRGEKELYQDRFILLSEGPYSAVAASDLHLAGDEWLRLSEMIRLHHECTHYFTKRVFDSISNNVVDEAVADYVGIVHALGHYRADWFLRFMGLENYPAYRPSGRLDYYRGKPVLSDGAFRVLQSLLVQAARNLELVNRPDTLDGRDEGILVSALFRLTLEEMATADLRKIY